MFSWGAGKQFIGVHPSTFQSGSASAEFVSSDSGEETLSNSASQSSKKVIREHCDFLIKILPTLLESSKNSEKSFTKVLKRFGSAGDLNSYLEELYYFGNHLERQGHDPAAAYVYEQIFTAKNFSGEEKNSHIDLAKKRWEILHGKADFSSQLPHSLKALFKELGSAEMLIGMTGAWAVGRFAFSRFLPYFSSNPLVKSALWGRGAHVLASTAALGIEAPAFTVMTQGIRQYQGHHTSWAPADLARSSFNNFLFLGSLKGGHRLGKWAVEALPFSKVGRVLFPEAATYLGIYGGHASQQVFNPEMGGKDQNLLISLLATRAHLGFAGYAGAKLMPKGLQAKIHKMEINARGEGTGLFPKEWFSQGGPFGPQQQLAWAAPQGAHPSSIALANKGNPKAPLNPLGIFMSSSGENSPGNGAKISIDSERPSGPKFKAKTSSETRISTESVSLTDSDIIMDESTPDPLIGRVIDNRYVVELALGEGNAGKVYKVSHNTLNKDFSMKVLRAEFTGQEEMNKRFLNEAKAASSIGSPHIIDISDYGRLPEGSTYFIMEYLHGKPLANLIVEGEPMPLLKLLRIGRQLTDGMAAAHRAGIIHRDLKPDNLFVIENGPEGDFLKILDFGIAKLPSTTTKLTRVGQVFGTPHYMSPEQAAGQVVDPRSDIYATGVILYEMATGKVPFDGESPLPILNQHITKQPAPPRTIVKDPSEIPKGLEQVILKCLEKNADNRYQSMEELHIDLGRLEKGLKPESVPPLSLRGARWPLIAGIGGTLALGGLGTLIYKLNDSDEETQVVPLEPSIKPIVAPPVSTETKAKNPESPKNVVVEVQPRDAHVFINGKDRGEGDALLEVKGDEKIQIVVKRKGYHSKKLTLDGSKELITIKLKPIVKKAPIRKPPQPPKKDDENIRPW